jgi:putative phage-type endonuclease
MIELLASLKQERVAHEAIEKWIFSNITDTALQYDALIQRTSQWYQSRTGRLTASKFGVIAELSKWEDARAYWHLMTGRITPDQNDNVHLKRGRHEEASAIHAYEIITSSRVDETGLFLARDPYSFLGASPDGLLRGSNGIIEVKSPANGVAVSISPEYMAQVQGQLEICSKDFCDFCSWHSRQGMRIWRIYRSQLYWDWILPRLLDFYKCLQTDTPPPPRSSNIYPANPPFVNVEDRGFFSLEEIQKLS